MKLSVFFVVLGLSTQGAFAVQGLQRELKAQKNATKIPKGTNPGRDLKKKGTNTTKIPKGTNPGRDLKAPKATNTTKTPKGTNPGRDLKGPKGTNTTKIPKGTNPGRDLKGASKAPKATKAPQVPGPS